MTVVHLVVGHPEHGVVRHGLQVAHACGHRVLHLQQAEELDGLPACDVVHVPFTDRLFGRTAEDAAAAFAEVAHAVEAAGASLSVTLHDVPYDDSPLQRRRRPTYDAVIAAARGVVVNSRYELQHVEQRAGSVHSLRMIRLPVPPTPPAARSRARPGPLPAAGVAVLGFVFPDRGYEQLIAALPPGATLVAVGRAADGHEDLPERYTRLAAGRFHSTGFVPDDELAHYLEHADVPVAPNRRVTASASIDTWLAHGRRPLVADSPYAREVLSDRPGSLTIYDPDDTVGLAAELRSALADPASTRLPRDTVFGPTVGDVGRLYRAHLASCTPPRAVPTARGLTVPDNRWDLLPSPGPVPAVSVVVPYYNAQPQLDLVLTGLAAQTHRDLEVIVVDDGSADAPDLSAARPLPVRLLRQDDHGFRAARARNLGARAARGDVLVFLDGDTVPEPCFVQRLTGRVATGADVLAVGRRRHADLSRVRPGDLGAALRELQHAPAGEVSEPGWLRAAYTSSRDLLDADRRSYRFVISAVLAVGARFFAELGGFDERFVNYGGEDWEFAHRARTGGAVLAHEPRAIAWHDGPDWAARGDDATRRAVKAVETATLAVLLPDPDERGPGAWRYPSVVVHGGRLRDVDALATVRSAAAADVGFWFDAVDGPDAAVVLADPRVTVGEPPADVLARAWCRAWLHGPADLDDLMALADAAERHGTVAAPALTLRSSRSLARAARHATDGAADELGALLFGHHDRSTPAVPRPRHVVEGRNAQLGMSRS